MPAETSFRFSTAIVRQPGQSVAAALRDEDEGDPDPSEFRRQHAGYVATLRAAGVEVLELPPLEAFPDSVFIEDAALCLGGAAIPLRSGAPSREGESAALRPVLEARFGCLLELSGRGGARVEGGDLLMTDDELLVGLSERTNEAGFAALAPLVEELGHRVRRVETPTGVLHFKTDCGLLDSETVFSTARLAASGCFSGYRVIEAAKGEEGAANLIRVNDRVLLMEGYPRTAEQLDRLGYSVTVLPLGEAQRVDGGPSCLSLRF